MLVLTREIDQSIVLGPEAIRIHVLEIRGEVVRLGIEAPDSVPIVREELRRPAASPGFDSDQEGDIARFLKGATPLRGARARPGGPS